MATVTQSRSFPSGGTATYSLNGSAPVTLSFPLEARTQTTTSWRTGGGVDLQDGQLDTPSNEAGVFNYLVGEAASRDTNPYRPYDTGHEFSTVKQKMVNLTTFTSYGSSFPFTHPNVYTGPVVPVPIAGYQGLYPPLPGSFPDVGKFGLIAVNETAPTNPASSFGQGFGELGLDGTPTLPGSELKEKIRYFRSLGKEYLNVEFGWLPFVRDIQSSARAVLNAHKLLHQFQRNSGRDVRRAFHFAPLRETTISDPIDCKLSAPLFGSTWDAPDGRSLVDTQFAKYQLHTVKETYVYFKGSFVYYLPDGDDWVGRIDRNASQMGYLLGTTLTPELLWQLTPWTWLVDWVTHIGRTLTNWSRFSSDGLVLKYGYLMATTSTTFTHTIDNWRPGLGSSYGGFRSDHLTTRSIRKERFRSTPYGFGVDTSHLTDFQWSILGALGLAKAPRALH